MSKENSQVFHSKNGQLEVDFQEAIDRAGITILWVIGFIIFLFIFVL